MTKPNDKKAEFFKALESGDSVAAASAKVGVSKATGFSWKGRKTYALPEGRQFHLDLPEGRVLLVRPERLAPASLETLVAWLALILNPEPKETP